MCSALRCFILAWLALPAVCRSLQPSPLSAPSLILPLHLSNCVEVDLDQIEELRSQIKNKLLLEEEKNNSNLAFGLLHEDWIRLKNLESRLPDHSLLKTRLRKAFRLLIVALYEAHSSTFTRYSSERYLENELTTKIQLESFHTSTITSTTEYISTSPNKVNYNIDPVGMYKTVNSSVSSTTDRLVAEGSDHDEASLPNPNPGLPYEEVSAFDNATAHAERKTTYDLIEGESTGERTTNIPNDSSRHEMSTAQVNPEEGGFPNPLIPTMLENPETASTISDLFLPKTDIDIEGEETDSSIYTSEPINISPLSIIHTTQTSQLTAKDTVDYILTSITTPHITTNIYNNIVNESHAKTINNIGTYTSQESKPYSDKAADGHDESPTEYTVTSVYDTKYIEEETENGGTSQHVETASSSSTTTILIVPDRSKHGKEIDRDKTPLPNNTFSDIKKYSTISTISTALNENTEPAKVGYEITESETGEGKVVTMLPTYNTGEDIMTNKPDKAVLTTTDPISLITSQSTYPNAYSTKPTASRDIDTSNRSFGDFSGHTDSSEVTNPNSGMSINYTFPQISTKYPFQEGTTYSFDRGRDLVTAQPKETHKTFTVVLPVRFTKPIQIPSTKKLKIFLPNVIKGKTFQPTRKKGCWNKNSCVAAKYIEFRDYFDPEIFELAAKL